MPFIADRFCNSNLAEFRRQNIIAVIILKRDRSRIGWITQEIIRKNDLRIRKKNLDRNLKRILKDV